MVDEPAVRNALRRQWERIAAAASGLDLESPSRIEGWRNAEVLAHLSVQPVLLGRFLATANSEEAIMSLEENLAGTQSLAGPIDAAARQGARDGRIDFARHAREVEPALDAADLDATVTTVQGPIRLADYLRTRCIEAVVHGGDLRPPVAPDPVALSVTVESLWAVLRVRAPELANVDDLPPEEFIAAATGRAPAPARLASVLPLMT